MASFKSDFLHIMQERGFIHQGSDLEGLDQKLCEGPVTAYCGFDATADSLHLGSLMPIIPLYWFQQTGNKPITLMGGGTTKVGDPTGKDKSRQLITDEMIDKNIAGIKKIFSQFLTYGDGKTDAVMVNNDDWLSELNYMDFLRDYGRHFTINRMMAFESVKMRLEREQPLSFLEFNYMILQGYDFLELNRRYGVTLQTGGSDQWGNMINGMELCRRCDNAETFVLTSPLLLNSAGQKMGKSVDGAIWVNKEKLPSYDFYQYLRNTEDSDVPMLLRRLTTLPMDEIKKLEQLQGQEINEAKKILAFEATKWCRGEDEAKSAESTAIKTFEQGGLGDDLPRINVPRNELENGIGVLELMQRAGLVASNGEARRLIKGGGARINDNKIDDAGYNCTLNDINNEGVIKLSAGKKKHALVEAA